MSNSIDGVGSQIDGLVQTLPTRRDIFRNGVLTVGVSLVGFVVWCALFNSSVVLLKALGVIICAVNLVQWFCILHEAGHLSLFSDHRANTLVGWFAGVITLTPFVSWQRVHKLHHIWTGWKDKDPTTSLVVPRQISALSRILINVFWFTRFPIFSIVYRVNNFCNIVNLFHIFRRRTDRLHLLVCLMFTALMIILAFILTSRSFSILFTLGFLLHHVLLEPIMLSQHSHIKQNVARLGSVKPFAPRDQLSFTRSLIVPDLVSSWILFGFEKHIEHHLAQNIPGRLLILTDNEAAKRTPILTWCRESRHLSGVDLLFSTSHETGWPY